MNMRSHCQCDCRLWTCCFDVVFGAVVLQKCALGQVCAGHLWDPVRANIRNRLPSGRRHLEQLCHQFDPWLLYSRRHGSDAMVLGVPGVSRVIARRLQHHVALHADLRRRCVWAVI